MELCIKRFISTMRRAKSCTSMQIESFSGEINLYLFEHYLTPFLNGKVPTVGDLDFSQFTVEDVKDFNRYLAFAQKTNVDLVAILNVFANAEPVAQLRRAFC